MKLLTRACASCLLVAAIATGTNSQSPCQRFNIAEYGRYESDGSWVVYIVPPKLKRECLIAFVERTHIAMPTTRIEFFDSPGRELNQYIVSAAHGLDTAFPYPEKWIKKHQIASLYAFAVGRGPLSCDWTLKFEKAGLNDVIIGRGPCHAPRN